VNRPPAIRIHSDDLIIDNFAGGGGASLGIEWALGRSPDIAVNHDPEAIAMHAANHPGTRHHCESVWDVDPIKVCGKRRVALAWFSPDCKHFSKAKGGKPVDKKIRGLAWVVIKWAKAVKPRVIVLENVEEFQDWGPLLEDGRPCPERRGFTFRRWQKQLANLGYEVETRELRACDFGAPTIRKRLFVIARCDGQPIVWPERSHGQGLDPYHTAAECIEWSVPCPSIFERKKPLAENTLRRIARGIRRYVIESPNPFIVRCAHGEKTKEGRARGRGEHPLSEPLPTQTASPDFALVTPILATAAHSKTTGRAPNAWTVEEPLRTTSSVNDKMLVAPTLINTRNGEREGQLPRVRDIEDPMPTVTGLGSQGALVEAFLARHYGGHENDGSALQIPIPTITAKDHHALVSSHLVKLKGTARDGQPVTEPLHTVQAGGLHYGEVRAFLLAYYGTEQQKPRLALPLPTITSRDRFGLVTVHGQDYLIADIGMRMLSPRELFRAQGFPDSYVIDPIVKGKPLSKTAQVKMVGNSVCPPIAAAIVRAQFAQLEAVA